MRKAFDRQQRLDCQTIPHLRLNLNCRDEIIPILAANVVANCLLLGFRQIVLLALAINVDQQNNAVPLKVDVTDPEATALSQVAPRRRKSQLVATFAARHRALRRLPIVAHND